MAGRISWFFLLAFIGANLLSTFAQVPQDFDKDTCGGICMKVLRKSGKVAIARCSKGKKGKVFVLGVDHVRQLAANGTKVGKAAEDFTGQTFTMGTLNRTARYQGFKVQSLKASTYLTGPKAWLRVSLHIFCQAGNITFGDEEFTVQNGSLKLFLELDNFAFCNGSQTALCKSDEIGEFAEIALEVKSRRGKPPKKFVERVKNLKRKKKMQCIRRNNNSRCPKSFAFDDVEGGDEMVAAAKCKKDGQFVNMSGDFPKIMNQGKKMLLAFRVPKFNDRLVIDPGVTLGDGEVDDDDDDDDKGKGHASSIQLSIYTFVVMVTALFMSM